MLGPHLLLKRIEDFKPVYFLEVTKCHILFKENKGRVLHFVMQHYHVNQLKFNTPNINDIYHTCVSSNSFVRLV